MALTLPLPASFSVAFFKQPLDEGMGKKLRALSTAPADDARRAECVWMRRVGALQPGAPGEIEQRDLTLVGIRLMLFVALTAIVRLFLPGPRVVNEAAEAAF